MIDATTFAAVVSRAGGRTRTMALLDVSRDTVRRWKSTGVPANREVAGT